MQSFSSFFNKVSFFFHPCPGFQGKNCSEDVLECNQTDLCKNGATCVELEGSFECVCAAGYAGTLCDTMDPCFDSQCQNGATCEFLEQETPNFRCDCSSGFTGDKCQTAVS